MQTAPQGFLLQPWPGRPRGSFFSLMKICFFFFLNSRLSALLSLADRIMESVNMIQLRSHMRKSAPKVLTRVAQYIQEIWQWI